jgi:hypothetical protein
MIADPGPKLNLFPAESVPLDLSGPPILSMEATATDDSSPTRVAGD